MADDTTAATTQADDAATAPVATPNTEPESQADPEPQTQDELRRLRNEARNLRQRTKDAEGKLTALEAAKLSDAEKLEKRATTAESRLQQLEAQLRDFHVQSAITSAARDAKFGARRPETMHRLVDVNRLTFDEDGQPTAASISSELSRVKADFPELFMVGNGSANGADRGDPGTGTDMNALIRRRAGL